MNRKLLPACLVACLAAGSLSVQAETSLELKETLERSAWVEGSNDLKVLDEDKEAYYLTDAEGNQLTDAIYSSFKYHYGFIMVALDQDDDADDLIPAMGILNTDGEPLIDCVYPAIDILNDHWILAYTVKEASSDSYDYNNLNDAKTFYQIDRVDIYYAENGQVSKVGEMERSAFLQAKAFGAYLNIENRADGTVACYDGSFEVIEDNVDSIYTEPEHAQTFEIFDNDEDEDDDETPDDIYYGVRLADDTVILEPTYDSISDYQGDYTLACMDDLYGLLDSKGELLTDIKYDSFLYSHKVPVSAENEGIRSYVAEGYAAASLDDMLIFINTEDKSETVTDYRSDKVTVNGASATEEENDGNITLIAADGQVNTLTDYEKVSALDFASGILYKVKNEDDKYGVIDWHGEEILSCQYKDITLSADGNYLLAKKDYKESELYSLSIEK